MTNQKDENLTQDETRTQDTDLENMLENAKKEADEDSDIEVEFYEMDSDEDKKDLAQKIEDILESNTDKK